MPTSDPLQDALHTAVNCYLSTLMNVANILHSACPGVGAPYQMRLKRLVARLGFNATPEAIEQSTIDTGALLEDYAVKAAAYSSQRDAALLRTNAALEEIVRAMAQREEFYAGRLSQFLVQMENTQYPTDPDHLAEVVGLHVAGLRSCVESMTHEADSLAGRMQQELVLVERRLADAEITDRATRLLNRTEMERRVEARHTLGGAFTLLLFTLEGGIRDATNREAALRDEIVRMAGERLGGQFRHTEVLARWSDREILVLFEGPQAQAEARSRQIVP